MPTASKIRGLLPVLKKNEEANPPNGSPGRQLIQQNDDVSAFRRKDCVGIRSF
jgi:hypothetical protein